MGLDDDGLPRASDDLCSYHALADAFDARDAYHSSFQYPTHPTG